MADCLTFNSCHTLQSVRADIIIAGAGLAGLSLAVELAKRPAFAKRGILILDRDDKSRNDRTWCCWATPDEWLPPVVSASWTRCRFFAAGFETSLDIAPYRYCMIRGEDFYRWAHAELARHPNVQRMHANITSLERHNGVVNTDKGQFVGELIFNSAFIPAQVMPDDRPEYPPSPFSFAPPSGSPQQAGRLLQHFNGWLVETEAPAFDPALMTLMDFRVDQSGQTRFVYVLPLAPRRALVEFTVFSPALLPRSAYVEALQDYLRSRLGISAYQVLEEEFGVIPMTDFPFSYRQEGRLIHIGTAAGFVKASSGYAFKRTQRKIRAFVDAWERTGRPDPALLRSPYVSRALDSIFLRVLCNNNGLGGRIFKDMFQQLPPAAVLRFLDEDATFAETLRLLTAPPAAPFLRAFFQQLPVLPRI